ncbi:MAG: hypothetical protein HZA81_03975 [Candidatus Taylorbacteria bacterium]|nr:hypothetical protein [Candidatus Taylorbacteria bacterium]
MTDRRKIKQLIKFWIALAAIFVIAGYGAFQAKDLAMGPQIEVTFPATGTLSGESLVEIRGTAKNISRLSLNGDKIFTDEEGRWSETVLLSYGYNIMTLEANDRFGRTEKRTLELIYK